MALPRTGYPFKTDKRIRYLCYGVGWQDVILPKTEIKLTKTNIETFEHSKRCVWWKSQLITQRARYTQGSMVAAVSRYKVLICS